MCGAFDSLQFPPPGNPQGFRRELKTSLQKDFSADCAYAFGLPTKRPLLIA
jgi:hypothetical protein